MRRIAKQFAQNGGASLSPSSSRPASLGLRKKRARFFARYFLICEVPTRIVRFRVLAEGDGSMPVEQVAGMLAMHCLALNRRLEDFEVLVAPESPLPQTVTERAKHLIAAGRSIGSGVKLSPPERSVLDEVVQNLSNKEIACRLKLSVRTVKFHVSSLLAKFDAPNRKALTRQVTLAQILRCGQAGLGRAAAPLRSPALEEPEECFAS